LEEIDGRMEGKESMSFCLIECIFIQEGWKISMIHPFPFPIHTPCFPPYQIRLGTESLRS
jgi:hypothetical protein